MSTKDKKRELEKLIKRGHSLKSRIDKDSEKRRRAVKSGWVLLGLLFVFFNVTLVLNEFSGLQVVVLNTYFGVAAFISYNQGKLTESSSTDFMLRTLVGLVTKEVEELNEAKNK